jgi:hypothetical protein
MAPNSCADRPERHLTGRLARMGTPERGMERPYIAHGQEGDRARVGRCGKMALYQ